MHTFRFSAKTYIYVVSPPGCNHMDPGQGAHFSSNILKHSQRVGNYHLANMEPVNNHISAYVLPTYTPHTNVGCETTMFPKRLLSKNSMQ